jgi:hypothetical protein
VNENNIMIIMYVNSNSARGSFQGRLNSDFRVRISVLLITALDAMNIRVVRLRSGLYKERRVDMICCC